MKSLLIIILSLYGILFTSSASKDKLSAPSSGSEEAVEQAVTNFFNAMRASDTSAMAVYLAPDASLHTVTESEDGNTALRQTDIKAFMNSVGNSEAGSLDEQLSSFTAHVDGKLATAWMDYSFFYNGEFSHCGVNTMNLILTNDGWKIFSIADTRRMEGC